MAIRTMVLLTGCCAMTACVSKQSVHQGYPGPRLSHEAGAVLTLNAPHVGNDRARPLEAIRVDTIVGDVMGPFVSKVKVEFHLQPGPHEVWAEAHRRWWQGAEATLGQLIVTESSSTFRGAFPEGPYEELPQCLLTFEAEPGGSYSVVPRFVSLPGGRESDPRFDYGDGLIKQEMPGVGIVRTIEGHNTHGAHPIGDFYWQLAVRDQDDGSIVGTCSVDPPEAFTHAIPIP